MPSSAGIASRGPDQGAQSQSIRERALEDTESSAIVAQPGPSIPKPNPRKSRPSLSDRTVESLSQVPPPPSPDRQRSNFLTHQSPMASPLKSPAMAKGRPGMGQPQALSCRETSSTQRRLNQGGADPDPSVSIRRLGRSNDGDVGSHRPIRGKAHDHSAAALKTDDGRPYRRSVIPETKEIHAARAPSGQCVPSATEAPIPPKSSAALRETIARAKAAHRAATESNSPKTHRSTDRWRKPPESEADVGNTAMLRKRVAVARTDGRLNIAALGLQKLPTELLHMYDLDLIGNGSGSWAESVDLTKLCAADNELSLLDDKFFPCGEFESPEDAGVDGSSVTAALEAFDLHGNQLARLSSRLVNLTCLTTLNLSRNKLDNMNLGVITQISALRELRLAENRLSGIMDQNLSKLSRLEVLDLSGNAITDIRGIGMLLELRSLSLSANRITKLPEGSLDLAHLREMQVAKNSLRGTLIPRNGPATLALRSVDVSLNGLTSLTDDASVILPCLQTLNIKDNRLKEIAFLSNLQSLTTFVAGGNQFTAIPQSLSDLPCLKNVDLSRNDIRYIDPELGLMECLTVLSIANNPVRDRRLLNLNTEDLKRELREKLETRPEGKDDNGQENGALPTSGLQSFDNAPKWSTDKSGSLDMSGQMLDELDSRMLEQTNQEGPIRSISFKKNNLSAIPKSIELIASTLVAIDLSHNKLNGDAYLSEGLHLDHLKRLNLSANAITSIEPLLSKLAAPSLAEIDVSRNRIPDFPVLRNIFPSLRTVQAADNNIQRLPLESMKGLHVVDISGNSINSLEPRIGLLAQEGLRTFLVGANTFRVPRRDVVEKGTEAILAWLRGRIPE